MPVPENEPVEPIRILLLIAIGAALLLWTGSRFSFLAHAEHVDGKVVSLRAYDRNSRRGTRFKAEVVFQAGGRTQSVSVSAGSAWRRNRPASEADLQVGDGVPLIYDPEEPEMAERDSFGSLWGGPLWLLSILVAGIVAAYYRPWSPRYISATRYEEPPDPIEQLNQRMGELLDELKDEVKAAK